MFEIRLLKALEKLPPEVRGPLTEVIELLSTEIGERLTKKDFQEFEKRFEAFAERTNENFNRVWEVIHALAKAQERTENKLEELAEAQKKTEARLDQLAQRMDELTEAQKKTEARLDKLAQRMDELAEAQKKTEKELAKLTKEVRRTKEKVEALSDHAGYFLEDRVYKNLPLLLKKSGIEVEGRLIRRYVTIGTKDEQVDVYGIGHANGKKLLILGEIKTRFSKKEIKNFEKKARRIAKEKGLDPFLVFIAYDYPPAIEAFLQEKDFVYFWSYDLEINP